jgi:hypothetical protein
MTTPEKFANLESVAKSATEHVRFEVELGLGEGLPDVLASG